MPVHAWTCVTAGTFHDFHNGWMTEVRNALNGGVLPAWYYALGEQRSGDVSPAVLTLHAETASPPRTSETTSDDTGMIAVAAQPPKVTLALEAATDAARQDFTGSTYREFKRCFTTVPLGMYPSADCDEREQPGSWRPRAGPHKIY